jgi:hypothetical protein
MQRNAGFRNMGCSCDQIGRVLAPTDGALEMRLRTSAIAVSRSLAREMLDMQVICGLA